MRNEKDRYKVIESRHGFKFKVDEWMSESQLRSNVPNFFSCTHGSRETYTMHRGQVIVRNTVTFTGSRPERRTTVYLCTIPDDESKNYDTMCISTNVTLNSVAQAKRFIDRVLDSGKVDD